MAADKAARLSDTVLPVLLVPPSARIELSRRHVLNRAMQEKSGRLFCNDDWDFEIPSLELYAAR